MLGAGSYGTVYQAAYGDELLAAKCMHASHQRSAAREARLEVEQELQREFRALSKASHVNIVQLLGVVLDHPDWTCLLMELADQGKP